MATEIVQYGQRPNGGTGARNCAFTVGGLDVLISGGEDDDAVMDLALDLAGNADRAAARDAAEAHRDNVIAEQTRTIAQLRHLIPPKKPGRIMSTGYVRFDHAGRPWLLSRRETGWSAFGVWFDGWDDLFRRYDVSVTGHGTDEHGMWWSVENTAGLP